MKDKDAPDLSEMNLEELRELGTRVAERVDAIAEKERQKLAIEFEERAAQLGMTAIEVIRGPKKARRRAPAKPKYRDPQDPARTWAGRGRRPVWLQQALDSGKTLDHFLIKAE